MPPGRGRGRGPGRGPGRGRGRGPAPVAVAAHRNQARQQAAAEAAAAPAPAPAEEPAPEAPPKDDSFGIICSFPRCEARPEYGFPDDAVAQFCEEHKSGDMIKLVADPENPKESSLEKVREYNELKIKLDDLKDAPSKAHACEKEIKVLSAAVNKEESDIESLTRAIASIEVDLDKEEHKPKGKLKIGRGKLGIKQSPEKIEELNKDKEHKIAKMGKVKGQKELDVAKLNALREQLPAVQKPYAEYKEIAAKMSKLKAAAIDSEPSSVYLVCRANDDKEQMKAVGDVIFKRLLTKV